MMPTQTLPAGDTASPTALGSGTHMDTQHIVTGECVCASVVQVKLWQGSPTPVLMVHILIFKACMEE